MSNLVRLLAALVCVIVTLPAASTPHGARNVVLIVADGLRWQEVFAGADPLLLNDEKAGGSWAPLAELRERFWHEDPRERRKLLFPFLWGTIARDGQLFGNQLEGSRVLVENGRPVSYPGYNEMLTGNPDPRIDRNDFGPNPNVTVFGWLNRMPEFHGKVEVFGTWSVLADIFDEKGSGLPVRAGATLVDCGDESARGRLFTELYQITTRLYGSNPFDGFLHVALRDHLNTHRPRVLFVGYGDTDLWAHMGRYDLLLETAHSFDRFVAELWQQLQSIPQYRDNTTFILTTDHGRGSGAVDWKEHGVEQSGSEKIWIAVLGPDTPALGERRDVPDLVQGQIATTVAAFLGQDFRSFKPAAAAPIADVQQESEQAAPHQ